jgi:hypothetical protein
MHSNGVISFRGKWYDPAGRSHVTGVSLYQEWISPGGRVREMSARAQTATAPGAWRASGDKVWAYAPGRISHHSETRGSLTCSVFFAICAERGAGVDRDGGDMGTGLHLPSSSFRGERVPRSAGRALAARCAPPPARGRRAHPALPAGASASFPFETVPRGCAAQLG